ncbi:DUF6445 family protein [Algibacillus agarilyticus]|uniref:DUF6445 family protein n=1 Tax=Algibacillus agarilyticus TaxID=2234133 RepID=UPI000DD02737|nr:DUF6445 family protein [Algibacillus agarilyticus]
MIEINQNMQCSIFHVGNEKTPILVIDDFVENIESVRSVAAAQPFTSPRDGLHYPGLHSSIGAEYGNAILRAIKPLFQRDPFNVSPYLSLYPMDGVYSLLTSTVENLTPAQSKPHFDTPMPNCYAVLHYLNQGDFGGTAFYRHNPSNFECISAERLDTYIKAEEQFISQQDKTESKYFTDSNAHFNLTHLVKYKQNRLVIYPTSVFHSIYVDDINKNVNSDPQTGRLTANFFLCFK